MSCVSDLNEVSYIMKESLTAFFCSQNCIESCCQQVGDTERKERGNSLMLKSWIPQKPPVMKLITQGEISEKISVIYVRGSEKRSSQSNQRNLLKHL